MPDKSDVSIVDCDIATLWHPDSAFDDASFDDDAVDSAVLAVRCHEACCRCFLDFVY